MKGFGALFRRFHFAPVERGWERKASVCERCPQRVVQCGVSYCGKPFLQQIDRDAALDGCGCPCRDKAKTPGEHCPIDRAAVMADQSTGKCNCKWCVL